MQSLLCSIIFCYRSSERASQTSYAPPRKDNVHIFRLRIFNLLPLSLLFLLPSFPFAYAMLYVLDYPFSLSHQWNSIRLIKISISARSRHLHEILLNNSHVCLIFDIVKGGEFLMIYSVLEKNHARGTLVLLSLTQTFLFWSNLKAHTLESLK